MELSLYTYTHACNLSIIHIETDIAYVKVVSKQELLLI